MTYYYEQININQLKSTSLNLNQLNLNEIKKNDKFLVQTSKTKVVRMFTPNV